jgi:hypothetical protein
VKRFIAASLLVCTALLLGGCSFENKYEKEADKITRAVMANDLTPVKNDIAPGISISRVKIAEYSDELNAQGKLESIKETTPCDPGAHCFTVKFEKRTYLEQLKMDDQGKVTDWHFKPADAAT